MRVPLWMARPVLAGWLAVHSTAATAGGPPQYSWTGSYVGAYAGGAWANSDASTVVDCGTFNPNFFHCVNGPGVEAAGSGALSGRSFTGGVQAGQNWQAGDVVYGLEADLGAFNLSAARLEPGTYIAPVGVHYAASASIDTDWLLTARARLGWAASSRLLLYATGGLALTEVDVTNAFADVRSSANLVGSGASSHSDLKVGWTAGGGAEAALDRHWSVKAEYLYVDFGSTSTSATVSASILPSATSALTTTTDLTAQIARLGLNYRF